MKKCIIITSFINGTIRDLIDSGEAFIICADGGYARARAEQIEPDVIIGDFDSLEQHPEAVSAISAVNSQDTESPVVFRKPTKKDLTDTALCIEYAVEQGFRHILVVGGLGGRADHSIANIQNLVAAAENGVSIIMLDQQNLVMVLIDDETILPAREGWKLSLFSYSPQCTGVTVTGTAYPLQDAVLTSDFPLGVSNEITGKAAGIKVRSGQLLIMMSRDL